MVPSHPYFAPRRRCVAGGAHHLQRDRAEHQHGNGSEPANVLRIGYQKSGLLAILKAQGSLDEKLKPLGYSIKWFEFPAGPQLLEALNANSVDFGYTGAPPPVFAQAGGVRFVYVGAEPSGRHAEAILVRSDSALHSVAELKGKRVALQKGSSSNYLLLEALKKAGLRYEDIRPVYLPPPMRAPHSKAAPSMHGSSGIRTTRPRSRR